MKERFIKFIKANFVVWAFLLLTVIVELTGVAVTSGKFIIRRPFMLLSVMAIDTVILFAIKNQRARYWCSFAMLMILWAVDLVFIVVYQMTGTTFDYSMLNLRGDAMAIVESVPIDFVFVIITGLLISAYMVLGNYYVRLAPKPQRILPKAAIAGITAAVLLLHGAMAYFENKDNDPSDLTYKLYSGSDSSYSDKGILGNFIDELYKGAFFSKVDLGDENELIDFIYADTSAPSKYFGIAKDYNVVTVLAESLEWFAFMNDLPEASGVTGAFPGGFGFDSGDTGKLRALYPNLYDFYDSGVVCVNHHAREKTDISENQAIIGNYPTDCYINYDYHDNAIPYSLPNVLSSLYGVESNSFHNGDYTFYNRNVHQVQSLGFKSFTAREQMAKMNGFTDYYAEKMERNLDSEMIAACKNEMFPSSRRFNTFITSITMHGQFAYRENLKNHYDKLMAYAGDWVDEIIKQDFESRRDKSYKDMERAEAIKLVQNPFLHYVVAAMEFDKAIGDMISYLRNTVDPDGTPLIDKTLIVMFGDHNAYYQTLSDNVKQVYLGDKNGRNYTDLFRVPMMLKIGSTGINDRITKFTTTTDIIPTVLDLLGLKYFTNLYYGNSIFPVINDGGEIISDEYSIIYSRAYNVFITDKLFFAAINNIKYRSPDATDEYVKIIENKALTLLEKTSHVNRIFYYDFLSGERGEDFYSRFKKINDM